MLSGFTRFGYEPFEEEGRIIASQKDGLTISIEPGGQLELSGRPFADVHVVAAELDRHIDKCAGLAGIWGSSSSPPATGLGARPRRARGCRRTATR